jgi:hypothetical protein
MRQWIDLFEYKMFTAAIHGVTVTVYQNPSPSQLAGLVDRHDLRGVVDGKNLFVASANLAVHDDIAKSAMKDVRWEGEPYGSRERRADSSSCYIYNPQAHLNARFKDEWVSYNAEFDGVITVEVSPTLYVAYKGYGFEVLSNTPAFARLVKNGKKVSFADGLPQRSIQKKNFDYDALYRELTETPLAEQRIEEEIRLDERAFRVEVPKWGNAWDTHTIVVHKNPTPQNLLAVWDNTRYGIMRGLIDNSDVYWWDAEKATHSGIAHALGLEPISSHEDDDGPTDPRRLMMSREGDGRPFLSAAKQHHEHPQLAKLLTTKNIVTEV